MIKRFYVVICTLAMLGWIFSPIKFNPQRVLAEQNQPANIRNKAPLYFEANQGQLDKRVKFSARGAGYKLFLTSSEAVYVIPERKAKETTKPEFLSLQNQKSSRAVAIWMKLSGANQNANASGIGELAGKHNYFVGEKSKWQSNVSLYQKARFENVYQGVDLEWRGNETGSIEHDFIVSPFASARQIEWRIEGADSVKIEADGSLVISTPFGELKQNAPFTYQETGDLRNAVESRFELRGENTVGFTIGEYDRSKPLTIDPASDLVYSTFLGGGTNETGYAIAAGANDTVYVTGETNSTSFPTTTGVFDETQNGEYDVFVTKLGAGGASLIYSTYLGGGAYDIGFGIAVDAQGNAYITGGTIISETPYPTTIDAPFPNHGGVVDAFVTKLNASGSQLVYSTFLGGSGYDQALAIAVNSGRAYVTGITPSSNFPTTAGAFDTTHNGGNDIFVTKIGAQGADLDYSTFIGGSENEIARGIAVDAGGNAFICGRNNGGNYPTTAGAFDTTANSVYADAIVTKLNAAGSALGYSTYIGGDNGNDARAIAVDSSGSAYITGDTIPFSVPFPTTAGAFDTTLGGDADVFVTKFNPSGSALVYSTFLGGDGIDVGYGIAVNSAGNAFVTGRGGAFRPQPERMTRRLI